MIDQEIGAPSDKTFLTAPNFFGQVKTADQKHWVLLFSFLTATTLSLFHNTLFLMVDTWYRSRTFSHCFLVVPMFLYLVWTRRKELARLPLCPNYWGLALLALLVFGWVLGDLAEVRVLQELAVISILIAMTWTLLGSPVIRALALPFVFLFFAVPFGTSLIVPLQDFTSWFVIHALTLSHVPAVLENHTISLPQGVWTVAETCSGIRFLLSSVVLGFFFSLLMYQSWLRRLAFLGASIVMPIVANGFRAYGTIFIAYSTNNKVAAGVDHIVYGGLFSILIQITLIAIGLRWREGKSLEEQSVTGFAQGNSQINNHGASGKSAISVVIASAAIMALAPVGAVWLWNRSAVASQWADPPVMAMAPWETTASGDTSWAPVWHRPDVQYRKSFEYKTERVDLLWTLFAGRDAIDLSTPSDAMANAQSWNVVGGELRTAMIAGQNTKVFQNLIVSGKTSRTVWSWYYVAGEPTADRSRVRFLQAKARLMGKPAEVAVVSLGIDKQEDASEERALQEFLLHANFKTTPVFTSHRKSFQSAKVLVSGKGTTTR